MTGEELEAAYEAKTDELAVLLQELTILAAQKNSYGEAYESPVLIEWTVMAYAEHMAGHRQDDDGDDLDDYFSFHSPALANHRAEGLLRLSLRRIAGGD